MGRSQTINVIMFSQEKKHGDGTEYQVGYYAMNKREMAQNIIKGRRRGDILLTAYAQTKTGCKMIGADATWQIVDINAKKLPKLIECPACHGERCQICNFSGSTTKQWLKGYHPWQLEYKPNRNMVIDL